MFTLDNFYKSKEWEAFRLTVIADRTGSDGFLCCAHCNKPILNKYDLIIHHIEELTEDFNKKYDKLYKICNGALRNNYNFSAH